MKSLAELAALRQQAQAMTKLREGESGSRLVVGMGTCGIAAGAREVMAALMDELAKRNLTDVTLAQTGCVGLCEMEPLLDVIRPGQPKVTYGYVTPDKVRRIIAQHVINGQVIGEWVIATK